MKLLTQVPVDREKTPWPAGNMALRLARSEDAQLNYSLIERRMIVIPTTVRLSFRNCA